ncbi:hypothetical protein DV737_g2239, partial [Chaetothyriales sp. CBS 132003]
MAATDLPLVCFYRPLGIRLRRPPSLRYWEVASGYDYNSRPQSSAQRSDQSLLPHPQTLVARLSTMAENRTDDESGDAASQNLLRPLSQPTLASRFPSLRRISSEAYRHRSVPPEAAANPVGSNRNSSEITFAVLYDDGPDYHVGQYDERGSMQSPRHRHDSEASFAPSFHTRDSRILSDDHFLERHPDYVANQRLLAEGYLNANDPSFDVSTARYPPQAEDMSVLQHAYPANEKRAFPLVSPTAPTSHSHESWCTCDEDHGHSMPVDTKEGAKFDLEAQNPAAKSGTPFLQDTKTPADYE